MNFFFEGGWVCVYRTYNTRLGSADSYTAIAWMEV